MSLINLMLKDVRITVLFSLHIPRVHCDVTVLALSFHLFSSYDERKEYAMKFMFMI